MSDAAVIDGVAAAAEVKAGIARRAAEFLAAAGRPPGLAVVLAGENAASKIYIRNKLRLAAELGFRSRDIALPADASEAGLLAEIARLNADAQVDGILVQLPLPPHISADAAIAAIAPEKDVDGFHPMNAGRLLIGKPDFVPCTPLGSLYLIRTVTKNLAGLHAVIVGRSNIVGKPMAHLLLAQDCTVTIAHSRTRDLPAVVSSADILVAAVGRAELIRGEWLKPGAIVIDVGINRVAEPDGKPRLVGDVHFESARHVARAITPVPGGVGPMTVAFLMANTCRAAFLAHGLGWDGAL
ncbi:MAG TPA: bifunctional methylenetetrahydrofolate dehydrogenase/methenyltetrahydrofolate cyclohydrolase FolD [Hyphomicrobiales bacterium]|nr:bifunctional methylenetetrahydrofolate dehydrogenase/methenyltetrahydrofolate cyclohydrolase FolD [Hyphomicrobiales bacterium]